MDGRTVKAYLSRIISDMDQGIAPQAPKWVRSLAGPAAAGLVLAVGSLGGCAGDAGDNWTRERVAQAKADGLEERLCLDLAGTEECDPCEVLGWYGDGMCDDFCDNRDPDCMTPCVDDSDCAENEGCALPGNCPPGAICIMPPFDPDSGSSCPEGAICILPPFPEDPPGVCMYTLGQCGDGVDNDGDGARDCSDSDCSADPTCMMIPLYGTPIGWEIDCTNGLDDDNDGLVDCDDREDCLMDEACGGPVPEYAVPFEGDCHDGVDNDHDGRTDCADLDCLVECGAVSLYAAPVNEICDNERDDDFDGLTDCDDPDCMLACIGPPPVALYAAYMDERCDNDEDDDLDGHVDCDDPDCENDPLCGTDVLYAAPFG